MTEEEIKKYYENDKLEDLVPLYHRIDKEVERNKGRRILILHIVFCAIYTFILSLFLDKPNILAVCALILPSLILSCIHYWVNVSLFFWMFRRNREDNERRENIMKRINVAQKKEQEAIGTRI